MPVNLSESIPLSLSLSLSFSFLIYLPVCLPVRLSLFVYLSFGFLHCIYVLITQTSPVSRLRQPAGHIDG